MKKSKAKPSKKKKAKYKISFASLHAFVQTLILCYLVYRVEGLHKQLHAISQLFNDVTVALSQEFMGAKIQFEMAIESILSLFGGSES